MSQFLEWWVYNVSYMKAKDFNLPDENGEYHRLSDYKGKWVVLYFYPKDQTPGCTKEACEFRDNLEELRKLGAVILGVSKDSVASHKKFSEKHHLNFPILSDESRETIKAYKAWGVIGTLRTTYLIDKKGTIRKVYEKVNPIKHASEIVSDLKSYQD